MSEPRSFVVAAAAYPVDCLESWDAYAEKIVRWVDDAVEHGAQLLVFPEYGAMELARLDGAEAAADLAASLEATSHHLFAADALHQELARSRGVAILAASGPVFEDERWVNRARFFHPDGRMEHRDKQMMTRFERERWDVHRGDGGGVIETPWARVGVLVCYDAEFPLLARALVEAGAEVLLVPACTDGLAGHERVRIAARARALEGQCVVVHAPLVGTAPWCPAVDVNVGAAGVYGPPDLGGVETGVLAEGALDVPGWVTARIDVEAIAAIRREGQVLNLRDWDESRPPSSDAMR